MIRILANDGIEKNAAEVLRRRGFEVNVNHYEKEELKKALEIVDILIVRSATKVTKDIIDAAAAAGKLKLIIRGGVGIDNIDAEYARQNGISVVNTPNASSTSVAELTIGHMFSLARNIGIANVTMREGNWNKKEYEGIELKGKTLGLVGFGRIAQETARIAAALGMNVIYTNRTGEKKDVAGYKYKDMDQLLKESDFISFHIPFSKGDGPLIGAREFALMKDGVFLINTARGGILSENDLLEAIRSGKVGGAAIDVFEEEPTHNAELCRCSRISVTPHIGGSTREAQERIGDEVVAIIDAFAEKELSNAGIQNI